MLKNHKGLMALLVLVVILFAFFTLTSPQPIFSATGEKSTADKEKAVIKDKLNESPAGLESERKNYEKAIIEAEVKGVTSLQNTVDKTVSTTATKLITSIIGPTIQDPEYSAYFEPGILNQVDKWMGEMYASKPASTSTFVAYALSSARLIPTAQAQGIGFSSLDPILSVWTVSRNIAYFLFVVIFIVIGFMIMFRHKINGQTVVTIQQAIPSIIVALIFVTFSYAIGGFLIDIMYLFLYLIVGLFSQSSEVITKNIFQLGATFIGAGFGSSWNAADAALGEIVGTKGVGSLIRGIGSLSVAVIVALAVLFGVIKLFVELLKSYVSIVLLIAFSPVMLMFGAIPGQNPLPAWIKNIVGNLSAFPTTLLILVVSQVLADLPAGTGGFAPPFLLGSSLGQGEALTALVGVGMLLATPEIVAKIKKALGAEEGVMGELAGAAGERIKTAVPLGGRAVALGLGGGGGAAIGGTQGLVKGLLSGRPLHQAWVGMKEGAEKGLGGFRHDFINKQTGMAYVNPLTGKPLSVSLPGAVKIAGEAARSIGAHQPDVLDVFTEAIDKKWNPEEVKRTRKMRSAEDLVEMLGLSPQDRNKR